MGVPCHVTPVPLALAAPLTQTPPSTTPVPMVTTPSQAPPTAPHVLQATLVVIPLQTQWCHVLQERMPSRHPRSAWGAQLVGSALTLMAMETLLVFRFV